MTTPELRDWASAYTRRLDKPEIEALWVQLARSLGFRVERTDAAYATFDGKDVIGIGTPASLDADDTVAQLIFHELCHAIVEGESGLRRVDWGLENTDDRDRERELACLRVQAALADRHGLRWEMAPTTVVRVDYLQLGDDPLQGETEAARLARAAFAAPLFLRWSKQIDETLSRTARLAIDLDGARVPKPG